MPQNGGLSACDPELLRLGRALTDGLERELHALRGIEDRFMAGDFADKAALAEGAELMNWIDDVRSFKKSLLQNIEQKEKRSISNQEIDNKKELKEELGQLIKFNRKAKGESQRGLAKAIDL